MDYRSRAAFKLMQIDRRFHIMGEGDTVVDLGAAPGGWLQVAVEATAPSGIVVGVDIQSIPPIEGARTIRGDIRNPETLEKILSLLGARADVVLSDMSPNISGNYSLDQARSVELVIAALEVAKAVLKQGGNLVAKVFEGDLLSGLMKDTRALFDSVKLHSPKASRPSSSEIYIIASGFRGPDGDI